jgi:hypothetical protein
MGKLVRWLASLSLWIAPVAAENADAAPCQFADADYNLVETHTPFPGAPAENGTLELKISMNPKNSGRDVYGTIYIYYHFIDFVNGTRQQSAAMLRFSGRAPDGQEAALVEVPFQAIGQILDVYDIKFVGTVCNAD